jgi:hypothetical protein
LIALETIIDSSPDFALPNHTTDSYKRHDDTGYNMQYTVQYTLYTIQNIIQFLLPNCISRGKELIIEYT